jgi:hypothetical protein
MRKGDYAIAYTKNPADGGTPLALILLTHSPYKDGADNAWVIRFYVVELIESELDPVNGHHRFAGDEDICETCGQGTESSWHERSTDNG